MENKTDNVNHDEAVDFRWMTVSVTERQAMQIFSLPHGTHKGMEKVQKKPTEVYVTVVVLEHDNVRVLRVEHVSEVEEVHDFLPVVSLRISAGLFNAAKAEKNRDHGCGTKQARRKNL